MNIHFYLGDEEETPITSFYGIESNPFKLGDTISLTVEELHPIEYNKYKPAYKEALLKSNKELKEVFDRRDVQLIKESKYVKVKAASGPTLTIEYHCNIVNKID